jgi:hypothetical protein
MELATDATCVVAAPLLIPVTLMMEALISSELSVLTRATRSNTPKVGTLQSIIRVTGFRILRISDLFSNVDANRPYSQLVLLALLHCCKSRQLFPRGLRLPGMMDHQFFTTSCQTQFTAPQV